MNACTFFKDIPNKFDEIKYSKKVVKEELDSHYLNIIKYGVLFQNQTIKILWTENVYLPLNQMNFAWLRNIRQDLWQAASHKCIY